MNISVSCFICGNPLKTLPIVTLKEKAIKSYIVHSEALGDNKHKLLENITEIQIHRKCRDDYYYSAKRVLTVSEPSTSRSSSRGSMNFDFMQQCLFCDKPWQGKKREEKYLVQSDELKAKFIEVSERRNDPIGAKVMNRISGVDSLVTVGARYHKNCYVNFVLDNKIEDTEVQNEVRESLNSVYKFIENNSDSQFTASQLLDIMDQKTTETNLLKYLKTKYGDNIVFYNQSGEDTTICFGGKHQETLSEDWYMHREAETESEHIRIIKIAAELVRKQIKCTQYNNKSYPSAVSFLDSITDNIPKYLKIFLDEVIMFEANVKQKRKAAYARRKSKSSRDSVTTDDNVLDDSFSTDTTSTAESGESFNENEENIIETTKIKIDQIGLSIVQAIRPKSFVSPLHLATGIYLNRKCGSKTIINMLAKLGVCASYHSVALHEISAMKSNVIKIEPSAFVQYVFDNADHNPSTLDGLNSFHCMGGICCVTPSTALTTFGEVAKLDRLPTAVEISEESKINIEQLPTNEFSLESIQFIDIGSLKFGDFTCDIPVSYSTHIWGSYLQVNLPEIRGFMDRVTSSVPYTVSRIQYLPFIEENPSDLRTVYTSLLYAAKHARRVDQKTIFVTFDYPLYMKAQQILCNCKEKDLENVVARIGGFHLLMSYFKAVGTIMEGSGLKELWGTVYATNSIDKMVSCTSFSRALRAHITTAHVIGELIAEFAESPENIVNNEDIEGIKKSVEPSSMEASPTTEEIMELIKHKKSKIQRMLKDFSRNPPTLDDINTDEDFIAMRNLLSSAIEVLKKRGPTAELWLQYFNFVMLAIRYIEAERLGNWHLHLYCVQQMLPVYHAAGHSNYVKAIQIYLQEMSKLQDIMDPEEYRKFTGGQFTVRRTEKAWAGIWTDMTIEQMLMRTIHTGAQGLSHGRGMTSSVMTRFLEGMPYAIEIMNQLEEYVNIKWESSDQHVDVTPARQKRDASDRQAFKAWLQTHNPFIQSPKLQSLSTGLVGDANTDCHRAILKGLASMASMVGFNGESYKYSKSNTVQTLISTVPTIELDGEKKAINTSLLFQRIAAVMINDPNIVKTALLYELAPFPMALFDDKGIMRESKKSELYDILKSTPFRRSDLTNCIFVVDGGFLLHKVVWKDKKTFGEIIADYKAYIFNHYNNATSIIFDGYEENFRSVKSYERCRRVSKKVSPEITFELDMKLTEKKDLFLANEKNKSRFITKLKSTLIADTNLIIKQAKEDADTLIIRTAIDLAEKNPEKKIVVIGTDVDLAALLIALTPEKLNITMWKPRASTKQSDSIYETHRNQHLKNIILFAHAFTGCDTTSAIYGKGKKRLLDIINKNAQLMQYVEVFYNPDASLEDIKVAGEQIMLALYGQLDSNLTLSQCRVSRFLSTIGKSKTAINLATLPPTSTAAYLHSLRTYYQVQFWLGNYNLNPEDWGWIKSETMYLPTKTTEKLAPDELLKLLHCTCTKECTNRCGCKRAGLLCSPLCKNCKGETCSNSTRPSIDDDNDDADGLIDRLHAVDQNEDDLETNGDDTMGVEEYCQPVLEDNNEEPSGEENVVETIDDEPPPRKRSKRLQKVTENDC